ncbi:MAG: S-layer homology domain-containing protein, partial [Armatimonadetes bacterium]|nr:S-layer homology domain-containing protein [Armatimonadota bacterium]
YDQIAACCDAGIVSGYGDGSYRPGAPVTRDQMAVYVARALAGGDSDVPDGPAPPSFLDVPNTGYGDGGTDPFWAYKHIEYCFENGVVQGYEYPDPDSPGETIYLYEPLWAVTRDQMAVYVARAMVAPSGEAALEDYVPANPRDFPDVPSTGYGDDDTDPFWAYKHIEFCVENEVVFGYEDGSYHPGDVVTRDQMAVYIARAFELTIP